MDGDDGRVNGVTIRVGQSEGDVGASCDIDDPSEGGASDLTELLKGNATSLTAGEDVQEVRGSSTRPRQTSGNASGDSGRRVDLLSQSRDGEHDSGEEFELHGLD